eukprot:2556178-Amphidinium_carterae.1
MSIHTFKCSQLSTAAGAEEPQCITSELLKSDSYLLWVIVLQHGRMILATCHCFIMKRYSMLSLLCLCCPEASSKLNLFAWDKVGAPPLVCRVSNLGLSGLRPLA